MQAVAIVLHMLAEIIGIVVEAEVAGAAGDVGGRHHPVPDLERHAFAVQHRAPGFNDLAHRLVAADQRIDQVALVRRAGILLALAAKGVLVGAADAGTVNLDDDGAAFGLRHRKFLDRYAAGPFGDGGANLDHCCNSILMGLFGVGG